MTNKQLKNLKDTLWTTADQLRDNSGLKSTEQPEPILDLIFLRFADVKYSKFEPEIKAEFDTIKGTFNKSEQIGAEQFNLGGFTF